MCKIHGRTKFINRQCLKCKDLKQPIYRITGKKDRFGKVINQKHFLYDYLPRLTNKNRSYHNKFMKRISHTSGIYGIFYHNTCLYIGQSVDISNRIKQHKENFKKAQNHLKGLRLTKKRISIKNIKHKVEYKYYELANKYKLGDLSFKKIYDIPKLKDINNFKELLTYAEQAMIDVYKPKFNHIAARPSVN